MENHLRANCNFIPVFCPLGGAIHPTASDKASFLLATQLDLAEQIACAGPLAISATLAAQWAIRRLKSRRHNGPPVG
jgi:hypothetical protein